MITAVSQAKNVVNQPIAQFGYIFGLDGLRLLAVGIVVAAHYDVGGSIPGGFGVSIFFFISGFLITRLLLAEEVKFGRIGLGAFYIRRFIRLLPPLFLMGAIAVPALLIVDPANFSAVQVILSFLYLGNIVKFGAPMFGWSEGWNALEPLWSLAVEEHFYLLLAPALLLFRSRRARVWLVAGAIVIPLLLRIWLYLILDPKTADGINYHFTFTRLDSMAWGVLLTLLLDARRVRGAESRLVSHLLVWGGGLLMFASIVHWSESYEIAIKYTVQGLTIGMAFLGVMFSVHFGWLRRLFEWWPFVHLGRISYEIYLWHFPILTVVLACVPSRPLALPLALLATVTVSEVAYRLTTKRLRTFRKRFGGHPVS